jgi:tetratricopeptide (TPR) repeat protein
MTQITMLSSLSGIFTPFAVLQQGIVEDFSGHFALMDQPAEKKAQSRRLDSWKEIAVFFGRDERTVKRWEKERLLPVHRIPGKSKGGVFAYESELRDWLDRPNSALANGIGQTAEDITSPPETVLPAAPPIPLTQPSAPPATPDRASKIRLRFALGFVAIALAVAGIVIARETRIKKLAASAAPSPHTVHAANLEAEDLYLKGRYYWNKRTPADLNRAVDYFTQSIVSDPKYAPAYVGLADSYNLLREFSGMLDKDAFAHSLTAARRAVELDDSLSEAHRTLAFSLFWGSWDFTSAEREFHRAIQLNPNDVEAHHWYATALLALPGRDNDAIAEIDLARRLDPASQSIEADRAMVLFWTGSQDNAIETLLQMESAEPDFATPYIYLARWYLLREQFPEHIAQARKAAQLAGNTEELASIDSEERAFRSGGPRALLEAVLKRQMKQLPLHQAKAVALAETLMQLGRKQEALNYLRMAYTEREAGLVAMGKSRRFDALRSDPGFRVLVSRVGVPHQS